MVEKLTIPEARILKNDVAESIAKLLNDFTEKTGLIISEVRPKYKIQPVYSGEIISNAQVELTVNLI